MYANLVNNLDELGFTEVEPYLSEYLQIKFLLSNQPIPPNSVY